MAFKYNFIEASIMAQNADDLYNAARKKRRPQIKKFDGRIHITAVFLIEYYNLNADLFNQALDFVYLDSMMGPELDGSDQWIDWALFYDLSISPQLSEFFPEERREVVRQVLGEYVVPVEAELCKHNAGDSGSCERGADCRCPINVVEAA